MQTNRVATKKETRKRIKSRRKRLEKSLVSKFLTQNFMEKTLKLMKEELKSQMLTDDQISNYVQNKLTM